MAARAVLTAGGLAAGLLVGPVASAPALEDTEVCGRLETQLKGDRQAYFRLEKQADGSAVVVVMICREYPDLWCRPTLSFDSRADLAVQWAASGTLSVRATEIPVEYRPEEMDAPRPDLVEFKQVDAARYGGAAIVSAFDNPGGAFVFGREQCVYVPPLGAPDNSDLK